MSDEFPFDGRDSVSLLEASAWIGLPPLVVMSGLLALGVPWAGPADAVRDGMAMSQVVCRLTD